MQCRFCGQMLPPQAPPPGYGYGYGGPPPMQQGYAPNPYGAPNPYAPNPYAQQYPVQGFGGGQQFQPVYVQRSGWTSGWSTFFWIRLGIALVVVLISAMGACVQAIAH
jgi:CubicO group peptidase (beta-lactamase class C family)